MLLRRQAQLFPRCIGVPYAIYKTCISGLGHRFCVVPESGTFCLLRSAIGFNPNPPSVGGISYSCRPSSVGVVLLLLLLLLRGRPESRIRSRKKSRVSLVQCKNLHFRDSGSVRIRCFPEDYRLGRTGVDLGWTWGGLG